jgi:hypothetical protein
VTVISYALGVAPWVLVGCLTLLVVGLLGLVAILFGYQMSGAWYRWKHHGALRERDVLFKVRALLLQHEDTETGELPALVCKDAIALIDDILEHP